MTHEIDQTILREAREAAAGDGDIRQNMCNIVTRALDGRPLDSGSLRHVLTLILEGAAEGLPEGGDQAGAAMQQAGEGIEDAMVHVAQASRLAIEEARSRADAFNETELKRAAEDLKTLDRLYIETMQDFAKAGASTARRTIGDLATHMERSGSSAAQAIRDASETVGQALPASGRPHLSDAGRAARAGIGTIAALGSAILAGIADGLASEAETDSSDTTQGEETKKDI